MGATRAEREPARADNRAERDSARAQTRAERDSARAQTRAERDSARAERSAPARARRSPDQRPAAPWGRFPLSELVVLIGIAIVLWGLLSGREGEQRIAAGLVLASLGGGELALREHLAGYRSHSALLAGVVTFAVVTVVVLGLGPVALWAVAAVAAVVFGAGLYGFRELFKRRSGGLGFR